MNKHLQATRHSGKPGLCGWADKSLPCLVLALVGACLLPAHAATEGEAPAATIVQPHTLQHQHGTSLDNRVRALSKMLSLDTRQQADVRKLLEGQREQVRRVWEDAAVPAPYRISATQAISDKTADQIRALLNDEQKKKYNPPKQPHEALAGSAPSVETWMNPAKPQ